MSEKALLPWFRRAVGVRGKSEHSGRGFYMCGSNLHTNELLKRIRKKIVGWSAKGYIESAKEDSEYFRIVFNLGEFKPYYRSITISKRYVGFTCGFTCD